MAEQASVEIYTKSWCPYCIRAKALLDSLQVNYQEISVSDPVKQDAMAKKAGQRTVPQIFIDDKPIGGCDDLHQLHRSNKLTALLFPNS